MRDKQNNFTAPILRKLRNRVANICSNPDCYAPTSGAKIGDEEGELNMGVGAHICAASSGGPRYDVSMTSAQRASYKNGIWLCIPCSNKIDKDPSAYPVDLLHEWKRAAEKRSQIKIGVPAQPDSAPQDLLVSALSGMPLRSGIAQALDNVHGAVEKALSEIDDRFQVKTKYTDGQAAYNVVAREDVSFSMELDNPQRYANGYRQLWEEGKTLSIDCKDVRFLGSPLFERINAESQQLQIGAPAKICTIKISTVDAANGGIEYFDDIQGEFFSGTVSGTFIGYSMNRMLKFEMVVPIKFDGQFNITVTPFVEHWNGQAVNRLPYFTKLKTLILSLNNGNSLKVTFEHQGEFVLSGTSDAESFENQFNNVKMLFLYLDAARDIAEFTNTRILFDDTETITGDQIQQAITIAAATRREFLKQQKDLPKPIRFNLEREGDGKKQIAMLEDGGSLVMQITQMIGDTILVFGQQIQMPRKTVQFTNALVKVTNKREEKKVIRCKVIPMEDFTLEILYLTADEEAAQTKKLTSSGM